LAWVRLPLKPADTLPVKLCTGACVLFKQGSPLQATSTRAAGGGGHRGTGGVETRDCIRLWTAANPQRAPSTPRHEPTPLTCTVWRTSSRNSATFWPVGVSVWCGVVCVSVESAHGSAGGSGRPPPQYPGGRSSFFRKQTQTDTEAHPHPPALKW
jgi:hypothetical protein